MLGVCCVDLAVMLAGAGRPVRQDDVFNVETSVDLDQELTPATGSTPGPFVIINIAADNADIDGQVTSDPRVQTNVNTRRTTTRPTPPPGFLDDNPFISNPNRNNALVNKVSEKHDWIFCLTFLMLLVSLVTNC